MLIQFMERTMSFYKKKKDPNATKLPDAMAHPSTNTSYATVEKLKEFNRATGIPFSRLIAIAIDNEFDSTTPFNYPIPWPETEYVEGDYMDEAVKIYNYMKNTFKGPIGYDMLLLLRLDIGVEDKKRMMGGVRELLEKNMIIQSKSSHAWNPKDYPVVRLSTRAKKKIDKGILKKPNERSPINDVE